MVDVQTIGVLVTAASVSVAAIYYTLTLRTNQKNLKMNLETRQAQLLMQIYQRFSETDFMRKWITSIYLMDYIDLDDFNEKYDPKINIDARSQMASLFTYFEGVGVLVEEKLIDIRLVSKLMSGNLIYFWEKWGPLILERRKRMGNPYEWDKTEFLYHEVKKLRSDMAPLSQ
jgi:hypothetical protein